MSDSRRIPFSVAIADHKLLKDRFEELSLAQRATLKVLYACELDTKTQDIFGWTEYDYFCAGQGTGEYDAYGYMQSVGPVPYTPKKYVEAWIIAGRRSGKTDSIASTIVCYEAALGGHEAYIRKGQTAICFQIAQDLRQARYALNFIQATLESSRLIKKLIVQKTADRIDLSNGLTIAVVPPSLKAVRGYACPVAVLDEVGVWYQDAEAANPDYEIRRAVTPGQIQFPDRLLVGISSPWNKAGLLYQYYEAGTDGIHAAASERDQYKDVLVWHSTSAAMRSDVDAKGKLRINKKWFESEQNKDPRAFERECLAVFQDSISGFLSSELLRQCISNGTLERPPQDRNFYVAAIDPAFRRDAFTLCIAHADPSGSVVIDLIRRWLPTKGQPVNPQLVLAEIAPILKAYHIQVITSDQYHADTLQQLALTHGFAIESLPFTGVSKGSIYANLQMLVNQKRIVLLDHPEAYKELRSLERTLTRTGVVQITAPTGQHDDVATAIALAAHKTAWLLPSVVKALPKEETPFERIQKQIARKRSANLGVEVWD